MSNKARVLVVDDDPDQLFIFCALLERAGYSTITADNGASALDVLAGGGVDLVICDVSMPVMSGLHFASTAKASPTHGSVPIVLMTAGRDSINFSECQFKADKFVMKHQFESVLLPEITNLL